MPKYEVKATYQMYPIVHNGIQEIEIDEVVDAKNESHLKRILADMAEARALEQSNNWASAVLCFEEYGSKVQAKEVED